MWLTVQGVPPATPTIVSYDAETLRQQGTRAADQESALNSDELSKRSPDEVSYLPWPRGCLADLTQARVGQIFGRQYNQTPDSIHCGVVLKREKY